MKIIREPSTPQGTFGTWYNDDGGILCLTCELPWLENAQEISCIPVGTYQVIPHSSPAHPNVWEVSNVPLRSGILIHNGNTENDSKGCIIVGQYKGIIDGLPAVMDSDITLNMLRNTLPQTFPLTIEWGQS